METHAFSFRHHRIRLPCSNLKEPLYTLIPKKRKSKYWKWDLVFKITKNLFIFTFFRDNKNNSFENRYFFHNFLLKCFEKILNCQRLMMEQLRAPALNQLLPNRRPIRVVVVVVKKKMAKREPVTFVDFEFWHEYNKTDLYKIATNFIYIYQQHIQIYTQRKHKNILHIANKYFFNRK